MMLTAIKEALQAKEISHGKIAKELELNKATITRILNGTSTCSEETKARVLKHIELLLIDKPDLNPLIYGNVDRFIRLLDYGIRISSRLPDEDAMFFFELKIDLKKFKARMNQDGADQETE